MSRKILIDGREFVMGRQTGIGRFLEGLLLAIIDKHPDWRLTVAMHKQNVLPASLDGKVTELYVPPMLELFWPILAKGKDLFLSPYPKLPWRKLPCPSIHTVHDVFYLTHSAYRQNGLRTMLAKYVLKHSLSTATRTWFVSQASQQACEALMGTRSHATVLYSPVDRCFSPSDKELKEPAYFLCVGNGLAHKNVEVLLAALQGTNLQLKCVGVSHTAQRRLMAAYPDCHRQVEFVSGVDDQQLRSLYQQAMALLLPSTDEGYGFPPLEAMACGTPAIVSDILVLRESTADQAMYCAPHDVTAWQQAMTSMLDVSVREKYRQQGLTWIKSRQGSAGWQGHLEDLKAVMEKF